MTIDSELRQNVLLSLQRALLGEVFPALRTVSVEISNDGVKFYCYVDGPPTEEDLESLECVETEVMADFAEDFDVSHEVLQVDVPNSAKDKRYAVFARRESIPEQSQKTDLNAPDYVFVFDRKTRKVIASYYIENPKNRVPTDVLNGVISRDERLDFLSELGKRYPTDRYEIGRGTSASLEAFVKYYLGTEGKDYDQFFESKK